jgi:hypothetical protein
MQHDQRRGDRVLRAHDRDGESHRSAGWVIPHFGDYQPGTFKLNVTRPVTALEGALGPLQTRNSILRGEARRTTKKNRRHERGDDRTHTGLYYATNLIHMPLTSVL